MSAVDGLFLGFFFATGAIVGSFANVCIHRLPRGASVVQPGSRCPACGAPIAFYDNVPVVSWLVLGGRCRRCRAPISARYPLVETLVALLFLAAGFLYGPTLVAASAALLAGACVILAATDLEARTLPDEVTLESALKLLTEKRPSAIGVTDALGRLVGLLTAENLGEMMMVRSARADRSLGPWGRRPAGA